MIEMTRDLYYMPYDRLIYISETETEMCHATGREVMIDSEWWYEYMDSKGNLHYAR